jgi:hypothetical protein
MAAISLGLSGSQRGVLLLFLSEPQPPTGKRLPYGAAAAAVCVCAVRWWE